MQSANCRLATGSGREIPIPHTAENETIGILHTNPKRKRGRWLRTLLALRVSVEAGRVQYKGRGRSAPNRVTPINRAMGWDGHTSAYLASRHAMTLMEVLVLCHSLIVG